MIQKLGSRGKVFYRAGAAGWSMLERVAITWLMYFYTAEVGEAPPLLAPVTFGVVMLLGRKIDAAAEPLGAL